MVKDNYSISVSILDSMNDAPAKTENALALVVADWLEADGWTVYEEVSPFGSNSQRADLTAKKGNVIWVIETKRAFTLDVLDQAAQWLPYAHFVSIGIWRGKRNINIIKRVCEKFHLGLITVNDTFSRFTVNEPVTGLFNRRANTQKIRKMLVEENLRTGNAGKPSHQFYTPFKKTIASLVKIVNEQPGISFSEALIGRHHYTDDKKAKINLLGALTSNQIAEIQYIFKSGHYFLYPAGYDFDAPETSIISVAEPKQLFGKQASLF